MYTHHTRNLVTNFPGLRQSSPRTRVSFVPSGVSAKPYFAQAGAIPHSVSDPPKKLFQVVSDLWRRDWSNPLLLRRFEARFGCRDLFVSGLPCIQIPRTSLRMQDSNKIARSSNRMSASCHVWTAPSWQGFSSRKQDWSVRPCVRPFDAVNMTAGHNALRGSGPDQKLAFDNAAAQVGCPDRQIDRLCITCCPPSVAANE